MKDKKIKKKRRLYTASESLALLLIESGTKGERTKSRNFEGDAWLFEATPAALQIAEDYYRKEKRPLPVNIRKCKALMTCTPINQSAEPPAENRKE